MIVLQLSDLTDEALQTVAKNLGLPITSKMLKADVAAMIAEKLEAQSCLFLIPPSVVSIPSKSTSKESASWKSPASVIAIISLIVAIIACGATWWGTKATIDKIYRDFDDETKKSWKAVKVYDILVRNTNSHEKWTGLTLDEIRNSYNSEVASAKGVKIEKEDLEEDALKKILFEMERDMFILRTLEDKFMIQRFLPRTRDCVARPGSEVIEREVFAVLKSEAGKYTVDKLADKIKREKNISSEDVYAVLNCMIARREIVIDTNQTIIPASDNIPNIMPKPKEPKVEPNSEGVPPQAPPIPPKK